MQTFTPTHQETTVVVCQLNAICHRSSMILMYAWPWSHTLRPSTSHQTCMYTTASLEHVSNTGDYMTYNHT